MKISIIVPVYNTHEYLEKCFSSIKQQNYNNIELIFVDDCSKDNSYEICRNFKSNNFDIKVLRNQSNSLAGYSRNRGLLEASGDYIWFVDSDDWLEPGSLMALSNHLDNESSPDIVLLGFQEYFKKEEIEIIARIPEKTNNSRNYFQEFLALNGGLYCMPFAYVYRRKFLVDGKIFFPELVYFEDLLFAAKTFLETDNISVLSKIMYSYNQQNNHSITRLHSLKKIKDLLFIYDELSELLVRNNILEKYHSLIVLRFLILGLSRSFQMFNQLKLPNDSENELRSELYSYLENKIMTENYWSELISFVEKMPNITKSRKHIYLYNLNYLRSIWANKLSY